MYLAMDSQADSTEVVVVEKHELVRQLQFPPGFRFVPTEEELVDVYLRGKIEGRKLPLDVVNEVTILEWQPGRLVETYKAYGEHKWYFFTAREPSSSNKEEPSRKVRVAGVSATWKATGRVAEIRRKGKDGKPLHLQEVIGTKRVLTYHSSDADEDGKWSMREYVLKEHGEIGQYALCSIQRKQHSETEDDNAGEAGGSSKRKRKTTTMEPGKPAEGAQQQEIIPHVPKKARKGKKKASTQANGGQQQITPQHVPAEPPLMPPEQDHQMLQQEQPSVVFDATGLPAVPLQGYQSDGSLQLTGSTAPTHAGDAHAHSFQQCGDMVQFLMQNHLAFCRQGEQPPGLTWGPFISPDSNGEHDQYQLSQQENYGSFGVPDLQRLYTEQYSPQNFDFFSGNITQNNSNWDCDQCQPWQQGNEGALGVQDQHTHAQYYHSGHEGALGVQDQHTHAQYYHSGHEGALGVQDQHTHAQDYQSGNEGALGVQDQHTHAQYYQSYEQVHGGVLGQTAEPGYGGSADQFTKSDAVASKGAENVATYFDSFVMSMLLGDVPEDKVGTQDDSNPALQSQHELQRPLLDNSSIKMPTATCVVGPPLAV